MYFVQVNKKHTLMTQRDKQFAHELRKKEQELNKLKDKLHSVLHTKQDKKFGVFCFIVYQILLIAKYYQIDVNSIPVRT